MTVIIGCDSYVKDEILLSQDSKNVNLTTYKLSEFNYELSCQDKYYIYNTLYNSLIKLSSDEYDIYKNLELNDDGSRCFVENGLWIQDVLDERIIWKKIAKELKDKDEQLQLTIATTTKCNANCSYCFENGIAKQDISAESIRNIIRFIKNHGNGNVMINWFGGEPLLNTNAIDSVLTQLRLLNINYQSVLVTNGSLLDKDIIEKCKEEWNVINIQVTLDGTRENYNCIKNYCNKSKFNFDKVIDNMICIAEKNIPLSVRFNVDKKNRSDILKVVDYCVQIFDNYSNVSFFPAFIVNTHDDLNEEERFEFIYQLVSQNLNSNNFKFSNLLRETPKINSCMMDSRNAYTIGINGEMYACENNIGIKEHIVGFVEKYNKAKKIIGMNDLCDTCKFMPKCMGGCFDCFNKGIIGCPSNKYIVAAFLKIMLEMSV